MDIQLKTLTPIWTGDHNNECHSLKLTGLTGSIRWWYEAMIRGLGGWACDPTAKADVNNKCNYDSTHIDEKLKRMKDQDIIKDTVGESYKAGFYTMANNQLKPCVCEACKLFGCNGWAKAFRIRIADEQLTSEANRNRFPRINNNKGYSIPLALEGSLTLQIASVPVRDPMAEEKVWAALMLALNNGALGAKTHLGYGVLKCLNQDKLLDLISAETAVNEIVSSFSHGTINKGGYDRLPVLTDFIFTRHTTSKDSIKAPLYFRYDWREMLRDFTALGCTQIESYHLRHYFCGIIENYQCSTCGNFLELQESKGLMVDETKDRLLKIRELKDHTFIGTTIKQVIDEALAFVDLDFMKRRFGLGKRNNKLLHTFIEKNILSYFCQNCNEKRIRNEYRASGKGTRFKGITYGKIASHQFASRGYRNDQGNMEMQTYAWFPGVLNKFFSNAQHVTRKKYSHFALQQNRLAEILECRGGDKKDWLINFLK